MHWSLCDWFQSFSAYLLSEEFHISISKASTICKQKLGFINVVLNIREDLVLSILLLSMQETKFALEQATKAQRGRRGIALLFL